MLCSKAWQNEVNIRGIGVRGGSDLPVAWQAVKSGREPKILLAHSVENAMAADSARPLDLRIVSTRLEAGAQMSPIKCPI